MKSIRRKQTAGCSAILSGGVSVLLLCCGCLHGKNVSKPDAGNSLAVLLLTEEEALAIAKRELGDYGYDHNAPIKVERGEDFFVFEFPEPPHGEPGEWCGADFAARVRVNAKTGKVDDILVGG